jgi:hypothetical protein
MGAWSSTQLNKNFKKYQPLISIVAVIIIAVIGYNLLVPSHADSPYASISASSGLLAGAATEQPNTGTVGGSNVIFNKATVSPSPSPSTSPKPSTSPSPSASPTPSSEGGCTSDGVVAPCIGGGGITGASGWGTPAFDDEFSSDTSLNLNKWQPNWLAGNNTSNTSPDNGSEDNCESPSNVSVSGGYLNLALIKQSCVAANNGETYPYTGSLVNTNSSFNFKYGYVETYMYLTPGTGSCDNWAAIWTDGPNWPTDGEVDIMECLTGNPNYHFHYQESGAPGGSGNYLSNNSGWHTFGASIEPGNTSCSGSQPDSVIATFYYDGTNVGSITECIDDIGLYVILDNDTSTGSIQVAPSTVKFKYVRVWE